MKTGKLSGLNIFYILLGAFSVLFILLYLFIVFNRINYPFALEWMEGGSVDQVVRILNNESLYVAPSLEFTPYFYTPLYFFAGSLSSKIFGVGFFSLRLVSFLASIGCFILIYFFIQKETNSKLFGLIGAGFFAATYLPGGSWLDIARVDSLFLFFLLLSLFVLRFYPGVKFLFISAILISLSFLTKQTALIIAVGISIYCLITMEKFLKYIYPVTVLVIIGLSTIILNWLSDGWYYFYIFDLPNQHPLIFKRIFHYWIFDLSPLLVAFSLSLITILFYASIKKSNDFKFYLFFFLTMLLVSWFSRMHSGGYSNVLLPVYSAVSICFGIGISVIISANNTSPGRVIKIGSFEIGLPGLLILILCLMQFISLLYNPLKLIPQKKDFEAGNNLLNKVRNLSGEVYIPHHGYLLRLAGKNNYAQGMAVSDILRSNREDLIIKLEREIITSLNNKRFAAVILDNDPAWFWLKKELEHNYSPPQPLFEDENLFLLKTGMETRPELIYLLKNN